MTDLQDTFTADESPIDRPKQLALFVNLDGFEGPIDLLLKLARDQKVDLTKIAILPLAEQYLSFVNNVRELDLEIAADYLVMAAWLAYLKSRLLLPDPEPEQAEEMVDMADALALSAFAARSHAASCQTPVITAQTGATTICSWRTRTICQYQPSDLDSITL
jgi:segregation and condensation protein A